MTLEGSVAALTSAVNDLVQTYRDKADEIDEQVSRNVSHSAMDVNIYVETDGNDVAGDGSAASPFLTVEAALKEIQKRIVGLDAAIVIHIGEGVFNETRLKLNHPQRRRVQLTGQGPDKTTINALSGYGIVLDGGSADASGIRIVGSDNTFGYGVQAASDGFVRLTNVKVESFGRGLEVAGSMAVIDVEVDGCQDGVYVRNGGRLDKEGGFTVSNSENGLVCIQRGYAMVSGMVVADCVNGIKSSFGSFVYAESASVTRTGTGGINGVYALRNGFIDLKSATVDQTNFTTPESPLRTSDHDPVFGNWGSWIYGTTGA